MPSKMKSGDNSIAHSILPSIMLSLNTSKVPSLILSESGSVIPSHSVEPIMSSSLSPSGIPLLSNRYCHVLKEDIGASPKTVVVWSVKVSSLDHDLVQNFTCMNPGEPIPHNCVVECTDKNQGSTYSSGEAFYCHRNPI